MGCFYLLEFGNDWVAGAPRGLQSRCPRVTWELGSIPRRSRHLKKSVSANILAFTDDKLNNYEQIPVQFNALESTQSLPIWSRFGHVLVLFFTTGIVW